MILDDVRTSYVFMLNAADHIDQVDDPWSEGVAQGYRTAANVLKALIDKYDDYNDHEPLT